MMIFSFGIITFQLLNHYLSIIFPLPGITWDYSKFEKNIAYACTYQKKAVNLQAL